MQRTEFLTELRQDVGYASACAPHAGLYRGGAADAALGIGANSAIFSVVHGVLLESLPYRDANRLHHLQMLYPDGTKNACFSAPDFMSVRQDAQVFEQIEAFDVAPQTLTGIGEPQEITTGFVTAGLFDFLGFDVAVGRTFLPEENRAGRANVAILSQGLWQRMFGGDPGALGQSVTLGGGPTPSSACFGRGTAAVSRGDPHSP